MDELMEQTDNPTWQIEIFSRLFYNFPVSPKNQAAIEAGKILSNGIPEEQLRMRGPFLTAISPQSHIGPFLHAIDFLVPDGTEVLAAYNGTVTEVVESNDEWGDGSEYHDKLNYVTIRHTNYDGREEYSQYCHLAKNSVRDCGLWAGSSLRQGSPVRVGQPIAKVGKSGWTDRDHLHFIVFQGEPICKSNPFGFRSLIIKFSGE